MIAVYLLDEITEIVSLGGETAQGMADCTMKRLGNKSPVVKQKVGTTTSAQLACRRNALPCMICNAGSQADQACLQQRGS